MEDLLRRSKIYPTFHWPKEFLAPMKKMREELIKQVDEEIHYVRMRRPMQSDGKLRICEEENPKEGPRRFVHKATCMGSAMRRLGARCQIGMCQRHGLEL